MPRRAPQAPQAQSGEEIVFPIGIFLFNYFILSLLSDFNRTLLHDQLLSIS